jgi:stearoyl-CoA 9-desaturase NADPH oxidoreductase
MGNLEGGVMSCVTKESTRWWGTLYEVASLLTFPRAPDHFVEWLFPLFSTTEVRACVEAVRRETEQVATLVLRPNHLWRGHRAGQWVALSVEVDGVWLTRCFSISSAPGRIDGLIEVTIKAVPDGRVTPRLVFGATPGMQVRLSQAQGDFVLPAQTPAKLLFISGGSGITPIMSMLRSRPICPDIRIVHFARSSADVPFAAELEAIGELPGVQLQLVSGDSALNEGLLERLVPDFAARETFACGPSSLLAATQEAFASAGASARFHAERFAQVVTDSDTVGTVTFRRSNKTVESRQTLLAAAEQAELKPASGCRAGLCRSCTRRKISGATRDLRTGEVSSEGGVLLQLCVSQPVGPVVIDL